MLEYCKIKALYIFIRNIITKMDGSLSKSTQYICFQSSNTYVFVVRIKVAFSFKAFDNLIVFSEASLPDKMRFPTLRVAFPRLVSFFVFITSMLITSLI